ncbi:MAG: hypothetical protein NC433_01240 [Clostridiales bacterium]|nr:hypothetical protein [Clostridiales bacterium]
MKEIMTKVSEYDEADMVESEGNNNMMLPCILGVILFIVCILCLFILWQKISGRNKTEIKAETYTGFSETVLSEGADGSLSEVSTISGEDGKGYGAADGERTQEEIMLQQYITELETLKEKVESSLQTMLETKETLMEAAEAQLENTVFKEKLSGITNEITELTVQLQTAETRIDELVESITIINSETITDIHNNISEIEQQIDDIDNDILDIYAKISELKTADAELQKKIDEVANSLKTAAEQSMKDITNQFNDVNDRMQQNMTDVTNQFSNVDDKMEQMEFERLQYLYDAGSTTLNLYSN